MLTGELRNKIDRLWETFWTGGITDPLDVVEQMTYLMFIHDLDETDDLRAKESAYAKYMGDAIFKIPIPLMLEKIVTAMDEIYAQAGQLHHTDVRGDIYEYLLSKLSTAGVNGQFRTPPAHHPHDGGAGGYFNWEMGKSAA